MLRRKEFQKLLGINALGYEKLKERGWIKAYKISHRMVYIEIINPDLKRVVEILEKEKGEK